MAFSANPLALSVPEPAFESWLRDTGYLEILDSRPSSSFSSPSPSSSSFSSSRRTKPPTTTAAIITTTTSIFPSTLSSFRTLISILTSNPFAKLAPDDFSGPTPSWTYGFVGPAHSYSWPPDPAQARMRVQENVRRYSRNYVALAIVIFACSLYQMPVALLGLVAGLGLWELLRFGCENWELEQRHPGVKQALLRLTQFVTSVVLYLCNIQTALIYSIFFGYTVMILHASLRKLTPSKQSAPTNHFKRPQIRKAKLVPK